MLGAATVLGARFDSGRGHLWRTAPQRCGANAPQGSEGTCRTAAAHAAHIARLALHVALHGSSLLAFPFLGRLLVEFAAPKLGQHSRLFAGALEPPQSGIEILVFSDPNARHRTSVIPYKAGNGRCT